MPRTCTICSHPERPEIDRELASESTPNRRIAARYGVSEQAIRRHRTEHLPAHLSTAHEAGQVAEAGSLLDQVRSLQRKALSLLEAAEGMGDYRTALAGVREARACLELLLETEGELDRRNVVNVLIAPQWIELRAVVIDALQPYPDARQAVAQALEDGVDHAGA